MHIDCRDGLVKFDYVPNHGYKFEEHQPHSSSLILEI
jgi:hypothetical protein